MKKELIGILGAALFAASCGSSTSGADAPLDLKTEDSAQGAARPRSTAATPRAAVPVVREVTIPAGTVLQLTLTSAVASDTSRVEDPIAAELTQAVTVDGRDVVPAGTRVIGVVTGADGAGRVKGRARVAIEFNSLNTGGARYDMTTVPISRLAPATKSEDATKIGIGAGAGAAIGAILGGKKGAAKGAAVGGGAGTGVVLATRGQEIRLASGTDVSTRLSAPLTVRVRGVS